MTRRKRVGHWKSREWIAPPADLDCEMQYLTPKRPAYYSGFIDSKELWWCPKHNQDLKGDPWAQDGHKVGLIKVDIAEEGAEVPKSLSGLYPGIVKGRPVLVFSNSPTTDVCTYQRMSDDGILSKCDYDRTMDYFSGKDRATPGPWITAKTAAGMADLKNRIYWPTYKQRNSIKLPRGDESQYTLDWACWGPCSMGPNQLTEEWEKYADKCHNKITHNNQYKAVNFRYDGVQRTRYCWINPFYSEQDYPNDGLTCRNPCFGQGPDKPDIACNYRYGTIPRFDKSGNLECPPPTSVSERGLEAHVAPSPASAYLAGSARQPSGLPYDPIADSVSRVTDSMTSIGLTASAGSHEDYDTISSAYKADPPHPPPIPTEAYGSGRGMTRVGGGLSNPHTGPQNPQQQQYGHAPPFHQTGQYPAPQTSTPQRPPGIGEALGPAYQYGNVQSGASSSRSNFPPSQQMPAEPTGRGGDPTAPLPDLAGFTNPLDATFTSPPSLPMPGTSDTRPGISTNTRSSYRPIPPAPAPPAQAPPPRQNTQDLERPPSSHKRGPSQRDPPQEGQEGQGKKGRKK